MADLSERAINGERIRALREERELSVDGLARLARVDASRLEMAERSDPRTPDVVVRRIAGALKLPVTEIATLPEQASPALAGSDSADAATDPQTALQQYLSELGPTTNGYAIISFVFGCIGAGLFAVCFGHAARAQLRDFPRQRGRVLAGFGLVLGYFDIVAALWLYIHYS